MRGAVRQISEKMPALSAYQQSRVLVQLFGAVPGKDFYAKDDRIDRYFIRAIKLRDPFDMSNSRPFQNLSAIQHLEELVD